MVSHPSSGMRDDISYDGLREVVVSKERNKTPGKLGNYQFNYFDHAYAKHEYGQNMGYEDSKFLRAESVKNYDIQ